MSSEKETLPENKAKFREDKAGPQGTLVFDAKEVDRLIAEEIQKQESDGSKVPALLATTKPHAGQHFILKQGKNVIGRSKGNSVTVYDPAVSATHAQLTYQQGDWKVLNLLSSNGTLINGEKVTERVLSFGDKIRVGNTEFIFTLVEKIEVQEEKVESDINWMLFSTLIAGLILVIGALTWLFW